MHLLDSNIIIYGQEPGHEFLDVLIESDAAHISAISIPEVLGFPKLSDQALTVLENVLGELRMLPVSETVLREAASLRRRKRMKLGDSIIAATALVHGLDLVTRNEEDFKGIEGLRVINPFAGK